MKQKIKWNMLTKMLLEMISIVCALILPRVVLATFGSEYNGIVSSVTQFLSFVTLLRAGVGGVTRAALYGPLENGDLVKISGIINATQIFMRRIAFTFAGILLVFAVIYPFLVDTSFSWFYTFSLILILGSGTFCQYYFGITNYMLLQADQQQYVYNILQAVETIANTILCVFLMYLQLDFRIIKLGSACVFSIVPIVLHCYVQKNYGIRKNVQADFSALDQRWDALAHQIAAFVHSNTDVVLLTLFCDLYQVSIYAVYSMVVNGISRVISIVSSGLDSVIGKLMARKAGAILKQGIEIYEWIIHVTSVVIYSCTAILIVPFVLIYTSEVSDADYNQPVLGVLLCVAYLLTSICLPYQDAVDASGKFKQTKKIATMEAAINIIISVPLVILLGHVGAVAGTVIATFFRLMKYARYVSATIINRPFLCVIKRFLVTGCTLLILTVLYYHFFECLSLLSLKTYFHWMGYSCIILLVTSGITIVINFACYPKLVKYVFKMIR